MLKNEALNFDANTNKMTRSIFKDMCFINIDIFQSFEAVHVNFEMCSLWSLIVYIVFKKRHFIIPQNSSEE